MEVTVIAAQSLDGFITRHDTAGTAWTSADDKHHFANVLRGFDCSIMGGETYRVAREFIRARLTATRRRIVMTRQPDAFAGDTVTGALEFSREPPDALLRRLRTGGHRRCALLGGSEIHSLFLNAGLVDELWITLEPRLFGAGTPFLAAAADLPLELLSHEALGTNSLLVRYRVTGRSSS